MATAASTSRPSMKVGSCCGARSPTLPSSRSERERSPAAVSPSTPAQTRPDSARRGRCSAGFDLELLALLLLRPELLDSLALEQELEFFVAVPHAFELEGELAVAELGDPEVDVDLDAAA